MLQSTGLSRFYTNMARIPSHLPSILSLPLKAKAVTYYILVSTMICGAFGLAKAFGLFLQSFDSLEDRSQ